MTLKNFLRGLGRRWYVVLIGLVLTGVAAGVVYSEVQPTYQRNATLLLMPAASSVPEGENPYLFLGGLGQASDVLVNTMASQTVRESLLDGHPAADATVQRIATSSGPLLSVTATGSTNSEVALVLDRALSGVQTNLSSLQTRADVPEVERITAMPLTTDETSTVIQKSRLEAVAATAAAGFALTLLLAGLVDGLLLSRDRRRRLDPPVADSAGTPDDVELEDGRATEDFDDDLGAPQGPRHPDLSRSGDRRVLAGVPDGFDDSTIPVKHGADARAPEHAE
ncbi:hypothetical protein B7495_15290 [Cryobacterium sp. LW097]|uniref:hypothetical protein n=1 Tax=unclassified Cryobacterium TaxID=2649013 RepID=UPI000B4C9957|nr:MULTISPECIES: hypothetical protein [unclassified Cryobacterium]ASD23306.1 hypothetical protein B7495_15290 [Cryobacterium sp. LW097]TFC52672.1 hypothetical protein E3O68_13390 [Cryobacterium sp. TMB3-1-2]TFC60284.1 hypothetical protein E3O60_06950 [Cryobacterium sp. TMB1-7]TFC68382.1 hypothetical protein E3T21_15035 [Cryobacterium sp. TMB3-15]TFC74918.1 hypothetical protein E3T22_13490 [Cryobacterium sp. TMB3-10]